ncbi:hypothetical protein QT22_00375, partial [Staphylococcus aureus]
VRQGDVAAAPVGIRPARFEIAGQFLGLHVRAAIFGRDAELGQPEAMDQRRLGLGDGVADHFGIDCHDVNIPRMRR